MVKIQGHRGSRGTHSENTLPAFIEAVDAHANGVELDLQVTKDGILVIHHDYFVNRSLLTHSDGSPLRESKLIRACTLAELKELDYGFSKNPRFPNQKNIPGTHIPTLEELFIMLHDKRDIVINLELKRDAKHPEWSIDPSLFAEKVLALVLRLGFEKRVYYSSFDLTLLKELHLRAPNATLGYITEIIDLSIPFNDLGITIFSPKETLLNKKIVHALQNLKLRVIPWTVNDRNRLKELIEMGIDEIITDYPRAIIAE